MGGGAARLKPATASRTPERKISAQGASPRGAEAVDSRPRPENSVRRRRAPSSISPRGAIGWLVRTRRNALEMGNLQTEHLETENLARRFNRREHLR